MTPAPADLPTAWRLPVELGFSVFPVPLRAKVPATKWKQYQQVPASIDTVQKWAAIESNIGIVTGKISGLVVLDLDSQAAMAEAAQRGLPDTISATTGKGLHVYFAHPGGVVRNRAGIFPGADIRGDGGYVVAPGSIHPTGKPYTWHHPPALFKLAPPPEWLLELLAKPVPKEALTQNAAKPASNYGERAIDDELAKLRRAGEGERNDALNRAAFNLAQLAAGGLIGEDHALSHLRATAAAIGLEAGEIDATIESGWQAGSEHPRKVEPRQAGQSGMGGNFDSETGEVEPLPPLPGEAGPDQWEGKLAPPRRFILKDWIVRGAAGLIGGQDGVGKSLLAQQLATCAAAGVPFLGLPIERCRAIYITFEDPADELQRRQEDINPALGVTMAGLRGWLKTYSLKGEIGNELGIFDSKGRLHPTARYEQIRRAALDFGAELVFIDNAAHVFPGNENVRHDVAAFLGLLERLSIEIDGAVNLLAHPNKQHSQGNKQGNEYSGTTGWSAHVRNRLFLDWNAPEDGLSADPDERVLRRSKANYAARGAEIVFRWHQWAFVRDEDLPPNLSAELATVARANTENEIFLRCLDKASEERRTVSPSRQASNFAPRLFAKMPMARGFKISAFEGAMHRLLHLGTIANDQPIYKRDNRAWARGLGRAQTSAQTMHEPGAQTRFNPHSGPPHSGARTGWSIDKSISSAALGSAAPENEQGGWTDESQTGRQGGAA